MPRILWVDDDTAVSLVFLKILVDAGYEVDATRYTALAKPMRPDALLAAVAATLSGGPR